MQKLNNFQNHKSTFLVYQNLIENSFMFCYQKRSLYQSKKYDIGL